MKKFMKIICTMCFLSVFLAGCSRVSEETLESVLERDPSFEKALDLKRRVDNKIRDARDNFTEEKQTANAKIRALREEINRKKENTVLKVESLKKELEPEILALKDKLEETKAEYRLKKEDLKSSVTKLANINKLLGKKDDLTLSGDEISVWQSRSRDLENDIASLEGQLESLRGKINLLKTELRILEQ